MLVSHNIRFQVQVYIRSTINKAHSLQRISSKGKEARHQSDPYSTSYHVAEDASKAQSCPFVWAVWILDYQVEKGHRHVLPWCPRIFRDLNTKYRPFQIPK